MFGKIFRHGLCLVLDACQYFVFLLHTCYPVGIQTAPNNSVVWPFTILSRQGRNKASARFKVVGLKITNWPVIFLTGESEYIAIFAFMIVGRPSSNASSCIIVNHNLFDLSLFWVFEGPFMGFWYAQGLGQWFHEIAHPCPMRAELQVGDSILLCLEAKSLYWFLWFRLLSADLLIVSSSWTICSSWILNS